MKKYLDIFFLLCIFVSAAGRCFIAAAEEVNKIVAVVNDELITQQELNYNLLPLYKQYKAVYQNEDLSKKMEKAEKDILKQMIENKLIFQKAIEMGIEATDEEIEKEVAEVREKFSSPLEFKKTLEEEGLNIQKLKERYKQQIMVKKAIQIYLSQKVSISPQEVSSYYEEHIADFIQPEKVKIRMLTINEKDKAAEVLRELRSGKEFTAVAREYSVNGDEKAKFVRRGEMIPEIDEVIFNLKIGEVSGVIKTELGYHIFEVEGKQEKEVSKFSKVMDKIKHILWQKKSEEEFDRWVQELKKDAYIEIK